MSRVKHIRGPMRPSRFFEGRQVGKSLASSALLERSVRGPLSEAEEFERLLELVGVRRSPDVLVGVLGPVGVAILGGAR